MDFFDLLPFIIGIGAFIISIFVNDNKNAKNKLANQLTPELEPEDVYNDQGTINPYASIDSEDYDRELEQMLESEDVADDILSGRFSKRADYTTDIDTQSTENDIASSEGKIKRRKQVTINLRQAVIESEIINKKY